MGMTRKYNIHQFLLYIIAFMLLVIQASSQQQNDLNSLLRGSQNNINSPL